MQRAYLIIDPQHEYARELITVAREKYDLCPICIYIDTRAELYKRSYFPELRGPDTLAHFYLDQKTPEQIAEAIRSRFEVVGIMPYFEQSLAPAAALIEALSLSWNRPDVLRRFRDKSGLKDFLRKHHPEIPLGASRRVENAEQVFAEALPERFVVKPNDGFANRDIGFFSRSDSQDAVAQYFAREGGVCVLEELLVGTEYAVNGQMDADGRAMVVNLLEYERIPANGKPNVYHRTFHVPRTDAAYPAIEAYTRAVMEASELRRAPFHLELMLTKEGPRLIEVGARFGGTQYVFMTNAVHGGAFSHFELAAHHYLSEAVFQGAKPDWDHYDRVSYVHLDGIANKTERIYSLDGVADIERMPAFDGWVVKPKVGDLVRRTVDLYSVPYSAHLKSFAGRGAIIEASDRLEQMLKFNRSSGPLVRALVDVRARATQIAMRVRWTWRRAMAHV